ncbi:MAG: MerR family transcriptional regulator [Caldisericaceae bacterium]|nr:MerR family transcriptional regulator [Caldisericaceae bacterium]
MSEKKPNYTIGQVADYFDLPQSVLRYWETVFDVLNPEKSAGGIRQYSDRDLKIISEIKHLLYQRGFTIKGANNLLNQKYHIQKSDLPVKTKIRKKSEPLTEKEVKTSNVEKNRQVLKKVIRELKQIVKELEKNDVKQNLM